MVEDLYYYEDKIAIEKAIGFKILGYSDEDGGFYASNGELYRVYEKATLEKEIVKQVIEQMRGLTGEDFDYISKERPEEFVKTIERLGIDAYDHEKLLKAGIEHLKGAYASEKAGVSATPYVGSFSSYVQSYHFSYDEEVGITASDIFENEVLFLGYTADEIATNGKDLFNSDKVAYGLARALTNNKPYLILPVNSDEKGLVFTDRFFVGKDEDADGFHDFLREEGLTLMSNYNYASFGNFIEDTFDSFSENNTQRDASIKIYSPNNANSVSVTFDKSFPSDNGEIIKIDIREYGNDEDISNLVFLALSETFAHANKQNNQWEELLPLCTFEITVNPLGKEGEQREEDLDVINSRTEELFNIIKDLDLGFERVNDMYMLDSDADVTHSKLKEMDSQILKDRLNTIGNAPKQQVGKKGNAPRG